MNLVKNKLNSSNRWRDVFARRALTRKPWPRRSRIEVAGDHFYPEWFAQQTWEDDGGRIGRDFMRAAS
jgi:hypothetical protein